MPKAILELEMPESCNGCKLNKWDVWEHHKYVSINVLACAALGKECSGKGRRSDCPLKLVDVDALEKQKPKKIVLMENTNKFKNPYGHHPVYGHCPVCGRIYWDKCHVGNYCDQCGQRLEAEKE